MDQSPTRLFAALLLAGVIAAQEAKDGPQPDPALAERLLELKKKAKDPRMALDGAAAAEATALGELYPKMHPKDQDKVETSIGALFTDGKLRPAGQNVLYHATAGALAKMGEDGARQLRKALEGERFKEPDYVPLRVVLIEALGNTGDVHQVDFLLELSRRAPQDEIMAAAGGALCGFTSLELQKRRTVVKDLIRRWGEVEQKGSQTDPIPTPGGAVDFTGANARKTLALIRPKWTVTLRALTGESHTQHAEWQRWLNKNPDWTPPGGK